MTLQADKEEGSTVMDEGRKEGKGGGERRRRGGIMG